MPSGSITITPGKQMIAGERLTNTKLNQGFTPVGRVDAATIGTRELIADEVKSIITGVGNTPFTAVISRMVTLSYAGASFAAFEARPYSVAFTGAPAANATNNLVPTLIVTGTAAIPTDLAISVRASGLANFVEVVIRNIATTTHSTVGAPALRLRITMLNFAA